MLFICLCVVTHVHAQQTQTYARKVHLSPMRMSYDDLAVVIRQLRSLVNTANGSIKADDRYITDRLRIVASGRELTVERFSDAKAIQNAPARSTRVSYTYQAASEAPISSVDIELADFSRDIEVKGTSPAQVDAITAMLVTHLSEAATMFGGWGFRLAAGLTAYVFIGLLLALPRLANVPKVVATTASLIALALMTAVWVLPWDDWFPGTAAYAGDVSFLTRYGPEISAIGVVLSVLLFVIGPWYAGKFSGPKTPTIDENKTPPEE
jgi:hypothetical protein